MFVTRFIGRLSGVAVMVALGCFAPAPLRANPADMLLVNGRIVTLDGASSINEALAITGDRMTAIGSSDQIACAKEGYRTLDVSRSGLSSAADAPVVIECLLEPMP